MLIVSNCMYTHGSICFAAWIVKCTAGHQCRMFEKVLARKKIYTQQANKKWFIFGSHPILFTLWTIVFSVRRSHELGSFGVLVLSFFFIISFVSSNHSHMDSFISMWTSNSIVTPRMKFICFQLGLSVSSDFSRMCERARPRSFRCVLIFTKIKSNRFPKQTWTICYTLTTSKNR